MERKQRRQKMQEFVRLLEHADGFLIGFDEGLRNATIETETVQLDGCMVFRWKNCTETFANRNCELLKNKL